ncbi:MAG: hypothetical protein HY078_17220 [Elusimicrobia bacterium]|nr:hypothetical protein [Elusimicrobiota bacterium]
MGTERLEGFLFDAYPEPGGIRVWIMGRDGRCRSVLDPWRPSFYFSGDKAAVRRGLAFLRAAPYPARCRWAERTELFSGGSLRVVDARVPPLERDRAVEGLKALGLSLYSADIHLVQQFHYDRGHFPLARCLFEIDGDRLLTHELRDDPWAIDYEPPPLRTMNIALSGSEVAGKIDPNHGLRGKLVLSMDGRDYELEGSTEEQLESLAGRLREWDPDVLTSEWGDSVLLPLVDLLAQKARIDIPFSRDPSRSTMGRRKERSFYTYGRVIYQNSSRYLFGRWHLDLNNSFMLRETGMIGLCEVSRIARIPLQRAARCTIGTSLTSMQMCWAWQRGVLIPMDKMQAEDFRPATELLVADKGGLCYEPEVGWHENVAEFDFTSMYPEMMVRHNISPETVNCRCCEDNLVPEIGHHLCRRRRGLVPSVLAPILDKRARYKSLANAGGPDAGTYKKRATAHKWILVCCFGYLGFKNARFGKIESHESVTAWGREVLLRAKETAEARGLRVLHALVDAVWVQVGPKTDLESLRREIEAAAGCPLGLEGVYKWIRYCPSKRDPLSGVPGRYFGAFATGELKIRGIAARRRDTPPLLKDLQAELLGALSRAEDLAACRAMAPALAEIVEGYRLRLKEGQVTAPELAITFNLSKPPEEYVHDTLASLAAKQLAASGVTLHAGETVRYVIVAAKEKVKEWRSKPLAFLEEGLDYDAAKYLELLERAADEVLGGLASVVAAEPKSRPRDELDAPLLPLVWEEPP